jgi:WD40 repeat protein
MFNLTVFALTLAHLHHLMTSAAVSWRAHDQGITSLRWAPKARTLLTASQDGTLKVWSLHHALLREDVLHARARRSFSSESVSSSSSSSSS